MLKQKLDDLSPGYVLPPLPFDLPTEAVERYRIAVGDESPLYGEVGAPVPPAALATFSLRALLAALELPPTAMHASQQLEFLAPVWPGESLICHCQVGNRSVRSGSAFIRLDFSTRFEEREVMKGRITLLLQGRAPATP